MGAFCMITIRFDSTAERAFDLPHYITSKLSDIKNNEEITLDFSSTPSTKLKRHLPQILEKIKEYNVVKLDFTSRELGDIEATHVAKALTSQRSIKIIDFTQNNIRDSGAKALANALSENPELEIDLSHNKISAAGAVAYVKAAISSGKTEINLSYNKLSNGGAKAVSEELRQNSNKVEKLILKGNEIGSMGDKYLANNVPSHVRIFYRTEPVAYSKTCPTLPYYARMALIPVNWLISLAFSRPTQELEGCIHKKSL